MVLSSRTLNWSTFNPFQLKVIISPGDLSKSMSVFRRLQ